MKCGIMTFHRAINYGGVLQAYALKKYISDKLSVDCNVIDYRCKNIEDMYDLRLNTKTLKGFITSIIKYPTYYRKKKSFEKFVKDYIKIGNSIEKAQLTKESDKYDIILTGSDQVWGKSRIGIDHSYFLDFVNNSEKKASYAASFGAEKIEDGLIGIYKKLLSDFKYISVREETGRGLVRDIIDKEAEVLIDPTLLLNEHDWKQIASCKFTRNKYLLIYTLTNSENILKTAKKIAKERNLKIYNISDGFKTIKGIKNLKGLSPQEWVGAFMNASYIVTNSFHGTAFSINFNKNFNVEISNGIAERGSRIRDILLLLGLESRLLNLTEDYSDINYTDVNLKLDNNRFKANEYLKKILK